MSSAVIPFHGCLLTGKWGWSTDVSTGRFSNPQQCYKIQRVFIPTDSDEPQNTGFEVKRTKLKVRGKGLALTLRFDSEEGKDFQILGWEIPYTMDGTA